MTHCSIWYHLYNLKNVKKNHSGVLFLESPRLFLKVTLRHGCFSHFLNCTNDTSSKIFWASWQFVQFSVSLRCHHGWHRGENFKNLPFWISRNWFSRVFLVHFLHVISAVFFVITLVAFKCLLELCPILSSFSRDRKCCFGVWRKRLGILLVFNQIIFARRKR